MELSTSWANISGLASKQQITILENKAYTNSIKEKCAELDDELIRYSEEMQLFHKKNKSLEDKNPLLKLDYNRELENIPIQSTLYQRLNEQLVTLVAQTADLIERKYKSALDAKKRDYNNIEKLHETLTPAFKLYQNEFEESQKLHLQEKIYGQAISDEEEIIRLKMDIHKRVSHYSIVKFVTQINELRENTRILKEINDIKQSGNKLLKLYENQIENERQGPLQSTTGNNFIQLGSQYTSLQLPAITETVSPPQPKPCLPATSITLNAQKFALDQKELQKIKDRELERQELRKRLNSKETLLFNSTSIKPPIAKSIVDIKLKENKPVKLLQDVRMNILDKKRKSVTIASPIVKKKSIGAISSQGGIKTNINSNVQNKQSVDTPKMETIKKSEPPLMQMFEKNISPAEDYTLKHTPSFNFGSMDMASTNEKKTARGPPKFSPYFTRIEGTESFSKTEVETSNVEHTTNLQPENHSPTLMDEGTFKVPRLVMDRSYNSSHSQVDINADMTMDCDENAYGDFRMPFSPTCEETSYENNDFTLTESKNDMFFTGSF